MLDENKFDLQALNKVPAVAVLGCRESGKTALRHYVMFGVGMGGAPNSGVDLHVLILREGSHELGKITIYEFCDYATDDFLKLMRVITRTMDAIVIVVDVQQGSENDWKKDIASKVSKILGETVLFEEIPQHKLPLCVVLNKVDDKRQWIELAARFLEKYSEEIPIIVCSEVNAEEYKLALCLVSLKLPLLLLSDLEMLKTELNRRQMSSGKGVGSGLFKPQDVRRIYPAVITLIKRVQQRRKELLGPSIPLNPKPGGGRV